MADHRGCNLRLCNCWYEFAKNVYTNFKSETRFAVDLFNFVLREYNVHWKLPEPPEKWNKPSPPENLFTKNIGEIIMFQLLLYRNAYISLRGAMFPNGYWSLEPLEELATRLFNGRAASFFPQLLVFCAYTCHMCLYCVMEGKYCLVYQLFAVTVKVIGVSLKDNFRAVGGWKAFQRFVDCVARNNVIAKAG